MQNHYRAHCLELQFIQLSRIMRSRVDVLILALHLFHPSLAKMEEDCCKKVYLFASLTNGDLQSGLMGIYAYQGQHLDRPYYTKTLNTQGQEMVFYLTYTDNSKGRHE